MNKTKIEWADYTWNPVTGCLHGCNYCYARRMAKRFSRGTGEGVNPPAYYIPGAGYIRDTEHNSFIENANIHVVKWPMYDEWIIREGEYNYRYDPFPYGFEPTFHRYRLDEPAKKTKGSKVFVCSMADLFGEWVPNEWIAEVFKACEAAPQHQYLFLTKNPKKYYNWFPSVGSPRNFWLGASAVNKPDEKVIEVGGGFLTTTAHCTADTMRFFKNSFISFEPLLNDVMQDCDLDGIDWVIVGAQTGPGAIPPRPEWVQNIIDQCKAAEIPIFLKDNLKWPEKIQEYPEGLRA
jgi:protein gp37